MKRSLLPRHAPIYLPSGWEPIDAALSWIAFGSALRRSLWDEYLFLGANDFIGRSEILHRLKQLSAAPGSLDAFLSQAPETPEIIASLPISVREQVDYFASELRQRQTARADQRDAAKPTDPDLYIRRAARVVRRLLLRQFKTDPRWDGYDWDEDLQALARAEYVLLRKIGYDDLPAFGWLGAPGARTCDATAPRIRIPPDLCKGPLSFDKNGMLLPCLQSDDPVSVAPLFWGILIPAEPLLVAWPNPERTQEDVARETSVPFEKRKPGRTPTHDWSPFAQELVKRVALDAGHLRRGELISSMKAWVAENMRTEPDDRTVERRVADLVPRGGVIPD